MSNQMQCYESKAHTELRRFVIVCGVILLLCLSLKLPSLFWDRAEDDEQIYWTLTQNWIERGAYSLQGTWVLPHLPAGVYDKPLFHHPPGLPILLTLFAASDSPHAAIIVSWLGHALAVVGVAMMCWTWRRRSWSGTYWLLWLPVLAVAVDPLFTFCARKLWPDVLLGGFVSLGMGFVCLAAARRSAWLAAAAGLTLGCATMVKMPGLIFAPFAIAVLFWAVRDDAARRRRLVVALAVPFAIVVAPWFCVFHAQYGLFFPDWIKPDPEMMANSTHVARAMARPWHYYISESMLVAPILLVVLGWAAARGRSLLAPPLVVPIAWMGFAWLVLMILYAQGHSMQLRFLTIAAPGMYAAFGALLRGINPKRSFLPLFATAALVLGLANVGFYLVVPQPDDIVSLPELVWRMAQGSQG